jgi:hypothetical protein
MSDLEKPAKSRPHRSTSQGFRAQREAALTTALRANLRRRKAAETSSDAASPGDHEKAQPDGSDNT